MTYVYEQYDLSLFEGRFQDCNRYKEMGGYHGIKALYEYLEELSESTGEPIEIDVIGLCCEWTHYDNETECVEEYNQNYTMDELEEQTTVIQCDDGSILVEEF